jgi:hypothetical protein
LAILYRISSRYGIPKASEPENRSDAFFIHTIIPGGFPPEMVDEEHNARGKFDSQIT